MEPGLYYKNRLEVLENKLTLLLKKESRLRILRFVAAAALLAGIYVFWGTPLPYIIAAAVVFSIIFSQIVFADINNKAIILHTRKLISINEDEVKALEHVYAHFEDGHQFLPEEHMYANDLDIFGKSSLYQYINRTTSDIGSNLLASWLLKPADPEIILQRQVAIKELSKLTDWRHEIQATGRDKRIQYSTERRMNTWMNSPDVFLNNKNMQWLRFIIPAIMMMLTLGFIFDLIKWEVLSVGLIFSWAFANLQGRKINIIHQHLSDMVEEMQVLSASLKLIEGISLESPLLLSIQNTCRNKEKSGSDEISLVRRIMEQLDLRLNLLAVPLEIYLCWSIHHVIRLERWKRVNNEKVENWFSAIAHIEVLNSVATFTFNNPSFTLPILDKNHFFLEGRSLGHPLIPVNKRINNNINIDHLSEIMLITGSNMAGKSTYLRSVGVNMVLAMTGSPVCAEYFRLSPVQVISSMRITDNLAESTSTFYAELKKLKTIIDQVNNGEKVFILLDEILRGTNSLDRHTGSIALLKQLIRKKAVGIIATHDLELAELKKDYPDNILNYHFDVQVNNEELFFDYKLKEGVCKSMNASILMKKIGIEID